MERTVGGALHAIIANLVIYGNATVMALEEEGDTATMILNRCSNLQDIRENAELITAQGKIALDAIAAQKVPLIEAFFIHGKGGAANTVAAHFGCPIRYGATQNAISFDPTLVRRQIGVVTQNGRLFAGTIMENIRGASDASFEQCLAACRDAGLADDLMQFPMGLHTPLTEGASTLSGGQRQRLLIARALVNRPRILAFDEATSALDNRTQAIVTASVRRLAATRIIVAHRLSTVQDADRIYVLDQGRIVEAGAYAELMALDGLFARLARRQIA